MARKALLETGYTFTPSTKTIVIPRVILRERLILITNVTTNQVIYNFSDANLKATAYTVSSTVNAPTTTITLNYDTSSMLSTDKIQIIIDEYDEKFTPAEIYTDPVNKFRVSEPQALIDTDFEYGTQVTKWENLALINNRPFAFPSATGIGSINYILFPTGSKVVTVGLVTTGAGVGTPITVQDTYLTPANGNYIIESVSGTASTIFTYTARAVNTTSITNILDPNKTGIFSGTTYTNARIGDAPSSISTSITGIATVSTSIPHGLALGNEVAIRGLTGTGAPNGSFAVVGIQSNRSFAIGVTVTPAPITLTNGEIFVRPPGQVLHRPFDGGVIFSSNANGNYETVIRQTRRYFRYQSGKGLQVSSGTILRPNLQVDSITSVGTAATVITKEQHNIQPGTTIQVSGVTPSSSTYNGTFTVDTIKGYNQFEYTLSGAASTTVAAGSPYVTISNWYGAANRLGIFDDQNGMFFEYDGQQLYAVRRNSTFQLSGKVTATNGSNTITQTNASFPTYFTKQLNVGDFIVIRGQSYRIFDIDSDTSLTITPAYRGSTTEYAIVSKTQDVRTPQSQWNIDKCDGTGPSGFNIDLGKMQMFYIDYSWYGAGFIRFGFRGQDGNVIYCHKVANNNVNTEAYMRSGNLPARYESSANPPITYLTTTLSSSATTVGVASTAGFPPSGTLVIRDGNTFEYVNYAGIGTTSFTGLTRAQAGAAPSITMSQGSNVATGTTTGLQVGMRAIHPNLPDGTWIASIGVGSMRLVQAATGAISGVVTFPPMGVSSGQTFNYSDTNPVAIELAFPTFGPTISHWGTSVIMDGRFDDDKSLIFTYGQTRIQSIGIGSTAILLGIRVSPSVDNGQTGSFGSRELINRTQLSLDSFGLSVRGTSNILVQAVLNGVPVGVAAAATWTNATGATNPYSRQNSSFAQIADYAGVGTAAVMVGGETISGFFVSATDRIELTNLRDLGNSILGGGGARANAQMYPDGPDNLFFIATNVSGAAADVSARISWKEAQA